MSEARTGGLAAWSVDAYELLIQLYPHSVRRDFGPAMVQVFRDQVRDVSERQGRGGLAALWRRTVLDLLISVLRAYAGEQRTAMFRATAISGALYAFALATTVGYGALRFRDFYTPPPFSRFGATAAHEDVLIAAYQGALAGELGQYRTFVLAAGMVLAVGLGVTAAVFGRWQKSVLHGAVAFSVGMASTIGAFELLPPMWFPLDRYGAGIVWLGCLPLAAAAGLLFSAVWIRPGVASAPPAERRRVHGDKLTLLRGRPIAAQ